MKYEVVNPSDLCYLESDDEEVAVLANLLLGMGMYALTRPDDTQACPIFMGSDPDPWFREKFGNTIAYAVTRHTQAIASCLRTVALAYERTSLNDIVRRAGRLADRLAAREIDRDPPDGAAAELDLAEGYDAAEAKAIDEARGQ